MHACTSFPLYTPTPNPKTTTFASTINHPPIANPLSSQQRNSRRSNLSTCRASWSSLNSPITEFNLYELLGVDPSSDRAQIKEAYRALQKRCHPDIAGPSGHDMAIVLNEAYALLSDPNTRKAYDKELAKVADMQGYTGRPIYSSWFGAESEQRAVFVDEVKCVGCLKCALFAENTFAIESVYGRARVVAQWADPEPKIQEAIDTCPVDCISIVERSNLAALEFLMSKQPRGKVRIGASNTAGERTVDIFNELENFQARYAKYKAFGDFSKESEAYGPSRVSAIQAIQMISNWLYWQSPTTNATAPATQTSSRKYAGPNVKRLKAAAAARKQSSNTARSKVSLNKTDEYWAPSPELVPPEPTTSPDSDSETSVNSNPTRKTKIRPSNDELLRSKMASANPFSWGVPIVTALVAIVVVRLQIGEPVGGVTDHVGGSLLQTVVNSSWLQCALAGVTWYLIGIFVVELVEIVRRK